VILPARKNQDNPVYAMDLSSKWMMLVEKLIKKLEEFGLMENTIIVFTSD